MPPKGYKYPVGRRKEIVATRKSKAKVFAENEPKPVYHGRTLEDTSFEDRRLRMECLQTIATRFPPDVASLDLLIERAVRLYDFVKGNTALEPAVIMSAMEMVDPVLAPATDPVPGDEALLTSPEAPFRSRFDVNGL